VQRIELSRERGASREICVSPGLLTGFVFDSMAMVDLQDELRFAEVTRGRTAISFMPPKDMEPGERLRLTAHFTEGVSDSITFVLVAHEGQATRQVEVYRDKRTRESFQQEVNQERARNQRLQEQLEQLQRELVLLRTECDDPEGLRRLILSRSMVHMGVTALRIMGDSKTRPQGPLVMNEGTSYRSSKRVAVAVVLGNSSLEAWTAHEALLMDAKGKEWKVVSLWQAAPIAPGSEGLVVVEVNAPPEELRGEVTVILREAGPRGISIAKVPIPDIRG
jgi:uncharacterized protein (TIGR02268 family)